MTNFDLQQQKLQLGSRLKTQKSKSIISTIVEITIGFQTMMVTLVAESGSTIVEITIGFQTQAIQKCGNVIYNSRNYNWVLDKREAKAASSHLQQQKLQLGSRLLLTNEINIMIYNSRNYNWVLDPTTTKVGVFILKTK